MRILMTVLLAITLCGSAVAQAPRDIVTSSRLAVEQLFLVPLHAERAFVSVETEYVEIGNPVMSVEVLVRQVDDPTKNVLRVTVEFVGERLHHLYATGSLLRDPPTSYREAALATLTRLAMRDRVGDSQPNQKKGCVEYRLSGPARDEYDQGGSSIAVFNKDGVLFMYGAPLPGQDARLGTNRPN